MTDRKDRLITDPALLRGLTMRRMSRRDLFRYAGVGAGSVSLAAILAACGGRPGQTTPTGTDTGSSIFAGQPTGTVNFGNWPLYIDKEKRADGIHFPSLELFTKETGIEINYTTPINDNAEFFGKIQPVLAAGQYTGYDIIAITNGDTLNQLLRLDWLVELPADMRPNFDQYASVAVRDPAYDPGNRFTMAWQSGITGIGWDPKLVAELRPDKPEITSVNDLFDPAFKGKVGMFGDTGDTPNLTMIGLGIEPETSTPDQWRQTAQVLEQQRDDGIVRAYYNQNYTNALSNGDVALTMAWSGDVYQLNAEGDVEGLQFSIPEEGAIIWTDNMCIPIGVENPVDAITYMDFVYRPDVQALIADWVNYISPVPAARDIILNELNDPTVANSPLVFPDEEDLANLHSYYVFKTPEEQQEWNGLFQPIYQG